MARRRKDAEKQWVEWAAGEALAAILHAQATLRGLQVWARRTGEVDLKVNRAAVAKPEVGKDEAELARKALENRRRVQREYQRRKRAKERGE